MILHNLLGFWGSFIVLNINTIIWRNAQCRTQKLHRILELDYEFELERNLPLDPQLVKIDWKTLHLRTTDHQWLRKIFCVVFVAFCHRVQLDEFLQVFCVQLSTPIQRLYLRVHENPLDDETPKWSPYVLLYKQHDRHQLTSNQMLLHRSTKTKKYVRVKTNILKKMKIKFVFDIPHHQ